MKERMFTIIWKFTVAPTMKEPFERIYGPQGEWAQLFRQDSSYRGTLLLCREETPGEYLTIDRWTSEKAYDDFRRQHAAAYSALDAQCASLTGEEVLFGTFEEQQARPPA